LAIVSQVRVRGTYYYDAPRRHQMGELRPGQQVVLVHEPTNPYDANAVAVHLRHPRAKLGYIPRTLAGDFAKRLAEQTVEAAEIAEVMNVGNQLRVTITICYRRSRAEEAARADLEQSAFWRAIEECPAEAGVYGIRCRPPDYVYVGSSVDLRKRLKQHAARLQSGIHVNAPMQEDFVVFGIDAFEVIVFEHSVPPSSLAGREARVIRQQLGLRAGLYNLTETGQGRVPSGDQAGRGVTVSERSHETERGGASVVSARPTGLASPRQSPEHSRAQQAGATSHKRFRYAVWVLAGTTLLFFYAYTPADLLLTASCEPSGSVNALRARLQGQRFWRVQLAAVDAAINAPRETQAMRARMDTALRELRLNIARTRENTPPFTTAEPASPPTAAPVASSDMNYERLTALIDSFELARAKDYESCRPLVLLKAGL
jgi:group I intron endonuclease